jgi:hypothetical protein
MTKKLLLGILFLAVTGSALPKEGSDNAVCRIISSSTGPSAYLLDQGGALSKGPVDFGQLQISADIVADQILIPSNYKLIVTPRRLRLVGTCSAGGCIKLVPMKKPKCKNSQEFQIVLGFSFKRKGGGRPYRYEWEGNHQFSGIEFEDPKDDMPMNAEVTYHFDPRVVGEIVDTK